MSQPGIYKLNRIAFYIMQANVPRDLMQGRYEAAAIINRIIKELKFKQAIKKGKKK